MAQARTEPPSEQRIAEARQLGHVPRTVMVGPLVSLAGLCASLSWLGARFARELSALYETPLKAVEESRALSVELIAPLLHRLGALLAIVLCTALLVMLLALFLIQGPAFHLGYTRPRTPFAPLESTRPLVLLLTSAAVIVVFFSLYFEALSVTQGAFFSFIVRVTMRFSLALVLVAIIEALWARASFFKSLWMTRQQRRDEQRQAFGSQEVRAARERARRDTSPLKLSRGQRG